MSQSSPERTFGPQDLGLRHFGLRHFGLRHLALATALVGAFSCADGCACGGDEAPPALPSVNLDEGAAFAPSSDAGSADAPGATAPAANNEAENRGGEGSGDEGSASSAPQIRQVNGTNDLQLRLQRSQIRPLDGRTPSLGDRLSPQMERPNSLRLMGPGQNGGINPARLQP